MAAGEMPVMITRYLMITCRLPGQHVTSVAHRCSISLVWSSPNYNTSHSGHMSHGGHMSQGGHMSPGRSHVSREVTCHKRGHMSPRGSQDVTCHPVAVRTSHVTRWRSGRHMSPRGGQDVTCHPVAVRTSHVTPWR